MSSPYYAWASGLAANGLWGFSATRGNQERNVFSDYYAYSITARMSSSRISINSSSPSFSGSPA